MFEEFRRSRRTVDQRYQAAVLANFKREFPELYAFIRVGSVPMGDGLKSFNLVVTTALEHAVISDACFSFEQRTGILPDRTTHDSMTVAEQFGPVGADSLRTAEYQILSSPRRVKSIVQVALKSVNRQPAPNPVVSIKARQLTDPWSSWSPPIPNPNVPRIFDWVH